MMNLQVSVLFCFFVLVATGCVFEDLRQPGLFVPSDGGADTPDAELDASRDSGGPVDAGPDMPADAASDGGDTGADSGDMGGDTGSDAGRDMGCSNTIPAVPMTNGVVCSMPSETTPGPCNPVTQTGCPAGELCDLQLEFSNGMPTGFSTKCAPYLCEVATKNEGEDCVAGDCAPGYKCNANICKRFCQLDDALGCTSDQSCNGGALSRSYGYCEPDCS